MPALRIRAVNMLVVMLLCTLCSRSCRAAQQQQHTLSSTSRQLLGRDAWATAKPCIKAPTSKAGKADTMGRLWGWEAGETCAFKDEQQQAITPGQRPALQQWQSATKCQEEPKQDNAQPDSLGRLWGVYWGVSCAFKLPSGAPAYYPAYTGPRFSSMASPTLPSVLTASPSPAASKAALQPPSPALAAQLLLPAGVDLPAQLLPAVPRKSPSPSPQLPSPSRSPARSSPQLPRPVLRLPIVMPATPARKPSQSPMPLPLPSPSPAPVPLPSASPRPLPLMASPSPAPIPSPNPAPVPSTSPALLPSPTPVVQTSSSPPSPPLPTSPATAPAPVVCQRPDPVDADKIATIIAAQLWQKLADASNGYETTFKAAQAASPSTPTTSEGVVEQQQQLTRLNSIMAAIETLAKQASSAATASSGEDLVQAAEGNNNLPVTRPSDETSDTPVEFKRPSNDPNVMDYLMEPGRKNATSEANVPTNVSPPLQVLGITGPNHTGAVSSQGGKSNVAGSKSQPTS